MIEKAKIEALIEKHRRGEQIGYRQKCHGKGARGDQ